MSYTQFVPLFSDKTLVLALTDAIQHVGDTLTADAKVQRHIQAFPGEVIDRSQRCLMRFPLANGVHH